ncbi:MAG: bifunctional (p)ppGpp synthetase/guanosine-3',5'-bis(diphosphate) 3'-pyrophosphohydrolase [Ignavibacteriae bacterium]|jgi:RelA/SpoT family (p)ppGpp synthetase|nr:bifunctional (p)ppGpp synthetase/guanosine-3',5'-bis(diphosphate) 3'-pyrophosphohydrolase [Ignavibacteriota bacterium]
MLSNYNKKKLDELITHSKINLSAKKVNEKLIANAFRFALDAHKNEKRESGEPYITHPYEVALILAREIPIDDITIAAALLHDVVEDTKFSKKDLQAEFGDTVAEIVDGATQIEGIFENYEMKQVESYKKMLLSMTSDLRVMLIKFADRLHNLRTLEFLSNTRQLRMAQETIDIYAPLAHRFGLSKLKTELEDLSFKYINRKAYDEIANKIKDKRHERDKFIKRFIEPLKEGLIKEHFKFEIYGRAKHIYSIYNKIHNREVEFDQIYDLFAVRIILDTHNKFDCFAAYGIVSQIYVPVPERFKNYISMPKQNGYRSIHTALMSKEGRLVEVQIRTREMHEIAEKGIAAHWKYKENLALSDQKIDEWMKAIRETFENAAKEDMTSKQLIENFKLELYQNEIYCFTPNGDLKILPKGATPIDFAFEIHTEVGMKCIGAKVNGKILPLDTPLKSGSQIEIITSKTQKPKRDWEKFVVTPKAKGDIRKYFNSEKRKLIADGREYFDKKLKKIKVHINDDELRKLLHKMKLKDEQHFFAEAAKDNKIADEVIEVLSDKNKMQEIEQAAADRESALESEHKKTHDFNKYLKEAQADKKKLSLGNKGSLANISGLKYDFAKCCNPIPGDDVIGYVTQTEGIKIHRKNCNNIINLYLLEPERILEINWGKMEGDEFTGGIKIIGADKPGILNEITETLSKSFRINIKSLNIYSKGSMFECTLILSVENLKQLNNVIEKINNHKDVFSATRFFG